MQALESRVIKTAGASKLTQVVWGGAGVGRGLFHKDSRERLRRPRSVAMTSQAPMGGKNSLGGWGTGKVFSHRRCNFSCV